MGDRPHRRVHRGGLLRGVHLQRVIRPSMPDAEGERQREREGLRDDGGIPSGADLTEPSRLSSLLSSPLPLGGFGLRWHCQLSLRSA